MFRVRFLFEYDIDLWLGEEAWVGDFLCELDFEREGFFCFLVIVFVFFFILNIIFKNKLIIIY